MRVAVGERSRDHVIDRDDAGGSPPEMIGERPVMLLEVSASHGAAIAFVAGADELAPNLQLRPRKRNVPARAGKEFSPAFPLNSLPLPWVPTGWLSAAQRTHTLEIVGGANELSFGADFFEPWKEELPQTHNLLYNAEDPLHGVYAPDTKTFAFLASKFFAHDHVESTRTLQLQERLAARVAAVCNQARRRAFVLLGCFEDSVKTGGRQTVRYVSKRPCHAVAYRHPPPPARYRTVSMIPASSCA